MSLYLSIPYTYTFICYLFISGSLFRNHLFVFYLFTIYYFAIVIWQFYIRRQKKSPTLSSGGSSVMRTTTEGGFYLRFRFLENFSVLASLFETEKVDFATDCHSLRCWLNLRNFSTESTVRELPSWVTLTRYVVFLIQSL